MENKGNGNTVLLTVVGIATLLVALVGATFAYFSATVSNNAAQSVSVQTANPVLLNYNGSTALVLPNALPGDSKDGAFTVSLDATSTVDQSYDLVFVVDYNEFSKYHVAANFGDTAATNVDNNNQVGQLLLDIDAKSKIGTNAETTLTGLSVSQLDFTDGVKENESQATDPAQVTGTVTNIVTGLTIKPGETQTFNLTLTFVNLTENQDQNKGKDFYGHFEVRNVNNVSSNG